MKKQMLRVILECIRKYLKFTNEHAKAGKQGYCITRCYSKS
jgi:hypothetical protein